MMVNDCLYKDSSLPIETRVADLLGRMTLEEKAAQLCGDLAGSFIENGEINLEKLKELYPHGHGRITQYSLVGLVAPEKIAEITDKLQDYFLKETRLGIPVALQSENLCGYPGAEGTLFPAQINVGATFKPEYAYDMSSVIGAESRAVGITSAMSPVIDVSRDQRWGRTYETYGEDHYLISQMGINYVKGMQEQQVSCIAKHFLGYAETQGGLNAATTRLNKRELYEVFATPFEAAAKEADLDAMMANYAEIDGLPVIDNPEIARKLLREEMGFKGVLTSDGAAVHKTFNMYKVANSYKEAGLLALKGGCDTEIPVGGAYKQLPDYVRSGALDEKLLDEAVSRVLTVKFKRGLFENPYADSEAVRKHMRNEEKMALSKKIAADSLVLLKNENNILPLKADKQRKVAVIGPHADNMRYPVSGYTYPAYIEMLDAQRKGGAVTFNGIMDEQAKAEASADSVPSSETAGNTAVAASNATSVNAAAVTSDADKKPKGPFDTLFELLSDDMLNKLGDMQSVLREYGAHTLVETLGEHFKVTYARGCDIKNPEDKDIAQAVQTATASDVVVMALGGNCGWVNVTGGEGKDRSSLALPGAQEELLAAVLATGKPVIVVLYGPGIFAVNRAAAEAQAIIQAWLPGPYAADVLAECLTGAHNPGGKLPVSIPRSVGQMPYFYNHKNASGYSSGADSGAGALIFSGGYVDVDDKPLYPFGHGLSYSKFQVADFRTDKDAYQTEDVIKLSVELTNSGDVAGDEVVQFYASFAGAHVVRPNQQLVAFKRVSLAAGETVTLECALNTAQLAYYNENMDFVMEAGTLTLKVGTSSANCPLSKNVAVTGSPFFAKAKRVYSCPVVVKV